MAVLASASSASTSTTPATTRSISGTVGGSSSDASATSSTELHTQQSQSNHSSAGANEEINRQPFHSSIQEVATDLICKPLRVMVSQNRRRYQENGFDLDLTYITDRIIAMGYPADTKEAIYRNSMRHTQQFLEQHHAGHYKVFNLRGQYVYDTSKFHHRVVSFEMTDHHPPRLELMAPFCREVHEYLEADPRNIVAVHCKAGKGRTGVMICAYLVYIKFYESPRQNMDYYSIVRTRNNKGVTIPSQRRYVYYFSHLRNHQLNYMPLRIELVGIYLEKPPKLKNFSAALSKNALNIRVANGDVDVFLGENMNITSEQWAAEEAAWYGNVVSNGPDSYDPEDPQNERKNVISRRAWGWTVPSHQRVFLEGDVRIDVYTKNSFGFGKFQIKNDRTKVGHIWMNTMFACPGFCGGAYKHGDEAHPYPEGATTIAERRPQHRPKAGSASLPNSPPSSPKSRPSGGPAARAPSFDARKSARTPPKLHINRAVKKLAEASSRNSEPHIGRNHDDRINSGAKSKKEKKGKKSSTTSGASFGQNSREWDKDLELMRPPGLDRHCPSETLKGIYGEKEPPRVKIEKMLKEAHTGGLIEDVYNQRRLSVPHEGEPVPAAPIGRPNADGPNMLIRQPDEHVQIYSILEIDRAFKNPSLDPGLKLIVVTRCVSADNMADKRLADTFLKVTHQKQEEKDKNNQAKVAARKSKIQVSSEPIEIGNTWNTSATCIGSQGGCSPAPISGGAIPSTLSDGAYRNDPRSNDPYMCRFFHRQREDSLSAYPNNSYRCPFQYPENAASGNGHASPVDADLNRFCSHPTSPMVDDEVVFSCGDPSGNCNQLTNHSGRLAASFTADWSSIGVPTSRSELSELDIEVRSYHPDDTNWNHSESSRSSSSSDGCAAPTSTPSALPAPVAPSSSPGSSSSLPPMSGSVGSVSPSPRNAQAPPPQFASRA